MDKKIDRLRQQQQRLWRKAAGSILTLHQNLAILIAFLLLIVLGIFWSLVDHKLEKYLQQNARDYGYRLIAYASDDLRQIIESSDKGQHNKYLRRLTSDQLITEAQLFDHQGTLLAKHTSPDTEQNIHWSQNSLTLLEDINVENQRIGIIQIKISRNQFEAPIQKLLLKISIITVVMMILAIILAWILSKRITKPLRRLLKFPINTPDDNFNENLDISSELKLMLESSSLSSASPAPVSNAEQSGIHQILAADSVADVANVVTLKINLNDLTDWLKPDSGTPNVHLLRQLDRILILTIHSQQGHLISFDGITAIACFGLDGHLSSAAFRATSCGLLLKTLLEELSLEPRFCLRKEERLLIRHMKRTPVAIPIHTLEDETDNEMTNNHYGMRLHSSISDDRILTEQIQLSQYKSHWMIINEINEAAQSLIDRQLTWIRHLLSNSD